MANDINTLIENVDQLSVSKSLSCTIEQSNQILQNPNKYIKIFNQNIRSINCNFLNLQTTLQRIAFDCDILTLTECWLSCSSNYYIPCLPNYSIHKTSRHLNQSDGVLVYIKTSLSSIVEEPDFNESASGLIIKINSDIVVICIYRSPSNENINPFLSALNNILPLLAKYKTVILTGDINIDIKTFNNHSHDYLNCLAFHGLLPAHTFPTRGNNCLDHIFLRTNSQL